MVRKSRPASRPASLADHDLPPTPAAQASVALEDAQAVQGLQRKVEELTAALNERVGELEVIGSIQRGVAGGLDFQGIVNLVGDKLRECSAPATSPWCGGNRPPTC